MTFDLVAGLRLWAGDLNTSDWEREKLTWAADRLERLEAVAVAAERVRMAHHEGYQGRTIKETIALFDALAALEAEDDRPSQTQAPTD